MSWECMEHTAYQQIRSVFGIPSIQITGRFLGLIKNQKLEKCGIKMEYIQYLESLAWSD